MKIANTLREAYAKHHQLNLLVEANVMALRASFNENWHFTRRIKSEESYAQKVESGQFSEEFSIEDFFACSIIVRNSSEVSSALDAASEMFSVQYRKPPQDARTTGRPTDFQFNDLRLYVKLKPSYLGPQPINEVLFEVQIKTFLQHAWSIATHDLTYKTDVVRWSKMRLASQIRAMLEHAELSIEQFQKLSDSEILAKEHDEYLEIDEIISFLKADWNRERLPADTQRLARSIRDAGKIFGLKSPEILPWCERIVDLAAGPRF